MLRIEIEQETDGRWLAEIAALPGVMAYGRDPQEARRKVEGLALHVLAERAEHGEPLPEPAPIIDGCDGLFRQASGRLRQPLGGESTAAPGQVAPTLQEAE